jgi:glycosyltransferase involved in cell wall biosynthesis
MEITIIIPTFNSAKTIKQCLSSIMIQDIHRDLIKVLVIDNNSSDETVSIINSFNSSLNLSVVIDSDEGIYDAMNKGIILSQSDFLLFLGSDDKLYDKSALKKCHDKLKVHPQIKLLWGNCHLTELRTIKNQNFKQEDLYKTFINHQAIIYSREIFFKNLYNTSFNIFADQVITREYMLKNPERCQYIDVVISDYSTLGASSIQNDYNFLSYNFNFILSNFGKSKETLKHANSIAIKIITSLNAKNNYIAALKGYILMSIINKRLLFVRTFINSLLKNKLFINPWK